MTFLCNGNWPYIPTFSTVYISQFLSVERLSLFCKGFSVAFIPCLIQGLLLWKQILSKLTSSWHGVGSSFLVWHSWDTVRISANCGWILLLGLTSNPPSSTITSWYIIILTNLNGHSRCLFIVELPTNYHVINDHKILLTICVWLFYATPDL